MKRTLVAALSILAFAGSAHAGAHKHQCSDLTPDAYAASLGAKNGKEYAALALPAKNLTVATLVAKSHTSKPEDIFGDGAAFVAGDGNIFVAFTVKGKVCTVMPVPMKVVNAIVKLDPTLADKPAAPPASSHEKHFEHHATES